MANRKISELTALTAPASGDYLPIVDISEAAAADKNKRITVEELLRGAPDGTNGAPGIAFEADPDSGFYRTGANAIAISTGGTGRMFINANGNVGVGRTPSYPLDVNTGTGVRVRFGDGTNNVEIFGADGRVSTGVNLKLQAFNNNIIFGAGGSASERLHITSTGELKHLGGQAVGSPAVYFAGSAPSNSLYVQATTGNVGIKTNAPDGELDVTGTGDANGGVLVVNDAGAIGVEVVSPQPTILLNETDTTDENYQIRLNSGDLLIQTQTDARTGASTKVTIDSLGKVGIGIAPSRRLSVQNSAVGTEGIALYRNTGDGTLMVGLAQDADGHGEIGVNNTSGTRKVQIRGNGTSYFNGGNVGIATTDPQNLLSLGLGSGTTTRILGQYGNNVSTTLEVGAGQASTFRGGMRIAVTDTVAGSVGDSVVSFHTTKDGGGTVQRLTIDEDGKVGIATDSPDTNSQLHIVGSSYQPLYVNTTGLGGGGAAFFHDGTQALYVGTGGSSWLTGSPTTDGLIRAEANLVLATNGNSRAVTIDSSGRLLVGTDSALSNLSYESTTTLSPKFQLVGSNASTAHLGVVRTSGGGPADLTLGWGSSGHVAAANQDVGALLFSAFDGSAYRNAAYIQCEADGAHAADDTPGRLVFSTTAGGVATPTPRMTIDNAGNVGINVTPSGSYKLEVTGNTYINGDARLKNTYPILDNTYSLGTASFRWSVVYAATGTINTSDAKLKQNIENLEQAELNVAAAIKGLIKKFRFIDAVAEKGDDARIHVGVIAQEVEQAFVAEGLDPRRYALFCEDTLDDGSKRLGIRYDELLAFVIAAL